jgi:queuine tRNA-ribosyltransferase
MLGPIYVTIHNIRYYLRLMEDARAAIIAGTYDAFAAQRMAGLENGQ